MPGELGLESGVPSPPAPCFLGRRVRAELEVVPVEELLPGRLLVQRCLPLRMDQMSGGHSRP